MQKVNEGDKYITPEDLVKQCAKDIHSLLETELLSDITIRCGDTTLKAHRCILSARSPVFKAMFKSSMKEAITGIVLIEDVEPAALRSMLSFLYKGIIKHLTVPLACSLLYLSDKYIIEDLKPICLKFLKNNLSSLCAKDVLQLLQRVHVFNREFKVYLTMYIVTKFPYLQQTELWTNFEKGNSCLALEISKEFGQYKANFIKPKMSRLNRFTRKNQTK